MFLHIGKIHQYIVQANKDEAVKVVPQEIVHHIHKLRRGIGKSKKHHQVFEQTPLHLECRLLNVSWSDQYLPIPRLEVGFAEHLGVT